MKIHLIFVSVILYSTGIVYLQLLKPVTDKPSGVGKLMFQDIANENNLKAQVKNVLTEDGYILTLFHIQGNKSKPVLLVHGNSVTADCWFIRGNGSLGITLAQQGYDVWAVNLRGTRYSRKHIHLNPDLQPERFFNYSFYEEAIYDMPATVDLILQETGQTQLMAVGHSVGTTLLYVLGAEKPEYNDKIKLAVSLAPISFLQNLRGLSQLGATYGPLLTDILKLLRINELFSFKQISPITHAICLPFQPFGYKFCIELLFFSVVGSDSAGFEPEFQEDFFNTYPGGTTRKTLEHILQVIRSMRFAQYDYGTAINLKNYQSFQPPEFDLKKVTMPSALFVGQEDFLGTVADAKLLQSALPNVVHYQVLPYEKFNHADFVWGRYMTDNFFPYLFEVIDKYN